MIAIAKFDEPLPERDPSRLDLEHSRRDIRLVVKHAMDVMYSVEDMRAIMARLKHTAVHGNTETIRHRADEAAAAIQLKLMQLVVSQKPETQSANTINNQQVNIYLPANGRDENALTNGHNGNGKH